MSSRTQAPSEKTDRAVRLGFVALVGGCCAVVVAGLVLIWSSVTTASARFSGSTSNDSSLFEAASVDVVVGTTGGDVTELRIDADGLYPGRVVDRCLPVQFNGSIDGVAVRLIGRSRGGTGLEEFVDAVVEVGEGSDNECGDFVIERTEFEGTLVDLWQQHGDFETGLEILESANDGDGATVRIQLEVMSDNQAQGLTSSFSILIEARP
ncbi:MAG: hypothetical protein KJN63_01680 [Acidimicrobiia bacterium]|nr:hypothetical protein [Acidimicrobiia bacterium]